MFLLSCRLRLLLLHLSDRDWPEQGATHTEVGHKGTEDKQSPSPRVQLDEQLHHWRQHKGANATAGHGNAVCQGLPLAEVAAHHDDSWCVTESETQTWNHTNEL